MALRKPLVIISGQVQQLSNADTLDAAVSEVDIVALTNANASAAVIGTPACVSAASSFNLARANASGTVEVIGLVKDTSVAASASGSIQTDGILTATTAQWDIITGGTGGLTAGSVYFLSSTTAGKLTLTAPTSSGEYVTRIGRALSTTQLDISITPPILL